MNTVGPAHVGGLDDLTDAAWLDEFDLGVLTMIRTTRAALPLLRKATFARVVNVAASSIRHQSPGSSGSPRRRRRWRARRRTCRVRSHPRASS